jgi:homospermidine synthase
MNRGSPRTAHRHKKGCKAAIWLDRPGAITRVHTWCPTPGPQFGFLVTHNEAISISDYYTVGQGASRSTARPATTPITPATTRCCRCTRCSVGRQAASTTSSDEDEIVEGIDELGVLLYGHKKNALLVRLALSNEETRELAPYQNATALQVTSAVLAGMVWALENPNAGIVEADEMDHARCLEVQRPILARWKGTTPTGPRFRTGGSCSPRISTRAIRGSSATCL